MTTKSGMSFIGNRWVFTGPSYYESEPNTSDNGGYVVVHVTAAGKRPVALTTTETAAQEMIAALSK